MFLPLSHRLRWEALHDEELTLWAAQPQEETWPPHHPQSTHGGIRGEDNSVLLVSLSAPSLSCSFSLDYKSEMCYQNRKEFDLIGLNTEDPWSHVVLWLITWSPHSNIMWMCLPSPKIDWWFFVFFAQNHKIKAALEPWQRRGHKELMDAETDMLTQSTR